MVLLRTVKSSPMVPRSICSRMNLSRLFDQPVTLVRANGWYQACPFSRIAKASAFRLLLVCRYTIPAAFLLSICRGRAS